ncbi:MAG: DUF4317 domain-containing protein [Clostridia bacterium]|nr:DUF4317 domain-containing protein [Clostridia bacterium]
MNSRDINEIRRRLTPDNNNLTCIRGCYVSSKKEIISLFRLPPVSLPPEECEKYLSLFKKVLSGVPDKNLVDIAFANEAVGASDEHKLLTALKDGALEDDDMAQVFFQRVIDGLQPEEACLILLAHDAYDIPFRNSNGERSEDMSSEMFRYILCAVCPVKLSKPGLAYSAGDNLFHPEEPNWIVGAPELGFMFPAFEERAANIYNALCYTKDTAQSHEGFVNSVFGAAPPMPAAEQKEAFKEILQDTLAEECSLEVVQSVHEQLCGQIAEQKHDREAPPLKVSAPQIRQALEVCGVPEEKVTAFEQRYREQFGGGMDMSAVNVVDTRQFEVRTPNVVIKVAPDHSDLVETRVINGSKYILIRADEGVEVNGVNVSILPM